MSHAVQSARDYLTSIGYDKAILGAFRNYEFVSPLIAAPVAPSTFADSPPINVRFRRDVIVLGLIGQVIRGLQGGGTPAADDLAYALTELRLQFGSNEDLNDNGYGAGLTAPMLMLFGRFNKPMYEWKKPRFAKAGIPYTATFRNTSATDTIKPSAALLVIELEALGPRNDALVAAQQAAASLPNR